MEKIKPETIIRRLRGARKLIKQGWTKGDYARNKHGHSVKETSPSAVRFCLVGAIRRECGRSTAQYWEVRKIVNELVPSLHGVTGFNDTPTTKKQQVIDLLDDAITQVKLNAR